MLRTFVKEKRCLFEHHFDTWQEAVRASYKPLLQSHVVEPTYIDAVISCIEKYGPYIVIAPDIAMPHASEGGEGVNDTAITFMKVEEPVHFDNRDSEKDARLFFSLAAVHHEQHLKNMMELSEMLMNDELVEDLLHAQDEQDLWKIADTYNL